MSFSINSRINSLASQASDIINNATEIKGTIPDINHSLAIFTGGTHACIYSNKFIENINRENVSAKDWDTYLNFNYINKRYMNNKLLCYQLFPETENSKSWSKNFFNMGILLSLLFKQNNMDIDAEPGTSRFYIFSNTFYYYLLFNWILLFILILLLEYYKKY